MYEYDSNAPSATVKPAAGRPDPTIIEGVVISAATGVAINHDSPLMKYVGPWLTLSDVDADFYPANPWPTTVELGAGQTVAEAGDVVIPAAGTTIEGVSLTLNGGAPVADAALALTVDGGAVTEVAATYVE